MAKWLSLLLLLCLISLPTSESITVYRLLLPDGRVIAYTEFAPDVGDYYWQAEQDAWYHVVRVEGDIGWLELTPPPPEKPTPVTQHLIAGAVLALLASASVYFYVSRRRKK